MAAPTDPSDPAAPLDPADVMENWRGLLNGILYAVQFSPALDDSEADRIVGMIRDQRVFNAPVERLYAALAAALESDSDLSTGIPQPHPDEAIRPFLRQVLARLG